MQVTLTPIGTAHTDVDSIPRHWTVSDVEGTLVIDPEYTQAIEDINAGQRIVVLFHFHKSPPFSTRLVEANPAASGSAAGCIQHLLPPAPESHRTVRSGRTGAERKRIACARHGYDRRYADHRHQTPCWQRGFPAKPEGALMSKIGSAAGAGKEATSPEACDSSDRGALPSIFHPGDWLGQPPTP